MLPMCERCGVDSLSHDREHHVFVYKKALTNPGSGVILKRTKEDTMERISIATPEEVLESEMAIITAAGIKVRHIGFQGDGFGGGTHLYDLHAPKLAGYDYSDGGWPTFSLLGMKERGLFK